MGFRTVGVFFFLILSLIIVSFGRNISSPLNFLSSIFTPSRIYVYGIVHAAPESGELQRLKSENANLSEKLIKLKEIERDNIALRSQFKDTTVSSQKLLPARIVGFKGPFNNPNIFLIDQGSAAGVKKDMAVIIKNTLVGKISKVDNKYSEVMLITHKNFTTLASTLDHNSPGIITGFDDFMFFDHVVITDTISKGEKIITKGELNSNGIGIPPGLILGSITKINKSDTKPFQNALVATPLNLSKITTVFVISEN